MYNRDSWLSSSFVKKMDNHFGVHRIQSGTSEEWKQWEHDFIVNHPKLNKFYENLETLQHIVQWPFEQIHNGLYYIRYRFIKKTHYAPSYLPSGKWYDTDVRMLHSMFGLLTDYVEIELAYMNKLCESNSYQSNGSWYELMRSREDGLKYIEWECANSGDDTTPAVKRDLYLWWNDVRPQREDPYEVTGYNEYCDVNGWDNWETDVPQLRYMLNKIRVMEEEYEIEDTEMMLKLVKIRHSLRA